MIILMTDGRTMHIPESDSVIGCCGDNMIERRQFLMPSEYKGVDIKNFSFVLKVQPVNIRRIPYYNELKKTVSDNMILLTWEVKKHDLVESGKLKVQLCVLNTDGVELNSYTGVFTVKNSIPASEMQGAIIPPTIFEQAVASTNQAVEKVENALSEATSKFISKSDIDTLKSELGTSSTYNVGTNEGDIPVLGADGKLPDSVIPKIATTEIYTASSNEEMENLDVQNGDICIRSDTNETYVCSNDTPSTRRLLLRASPPTSSKWKRIASNIESEEKQDSTDENLLTENKTIVGAINEIYATRSEGNEIRYGTLTLTGNWDVDEYGFYSQEVAIDWILETDKITLDIVIGDSMEETQEILDIWSNVYRAVTKNGSIKFYAYGSIPKKSIQIRFECKS